MIRKPGLHLRRNPAGVWPIVVVLLSLASATAAQDAALARLFPSLQENAPLEVEAARKLQRLVEALEKLDEYKATRTWTLDLGCSGSAGLYPNYFSGWDRFDVDFAVERGITGQEYAVVRLHKKEANAPLLELIDEDIQGAKRAGNPSVIETKCGRLGSIACEVWAPRPNRYVGRKIIVPIDPLASHGSAQRWWDTLNGEVRHYLGWGEGCAHFDGRSKTDSLYNKISYTGLGLDETTVAALELWPPYQPEGSQFQQQAGKPAFNPEAARALLGGPVFTQLHQQALRSVDRWLRGQHGANLDRSQKQLNDWLRSYFGDDEFGRVYAAQLGSEQLASANSEQENLLRCARQLDAARTQLQYPKEPWKHEGLRKGVFLYFDRMHAREYYAQHGPVPPNRQAERP
jgi:hypothetical protein